MKLFVIIVYFIFVQFPLSVYSDASVSPILFFIRNSKSGYLAKKARVSDSDEIPVTIRFANTPDTNTLNKLEKHGLTFKKANGEILHTQHIYCALVNLDSLETLAGYDEIIRIESVYNPSRTSTLDVSNQLVQASQVRQLTHNSSPIDGSGVIVANVDTGVDLFHPAFFKPDGGTYNWIDVNESGLFESGIDAVDLNKNGLRDTGETLRFFDASFIDDYSIMHNNRDVYDADIDWLYNDKNGNGIRDFGIEHGYTDNSPSFGELFFIISDNNGNNYLDTNETLTALGTSKFLATFDKNGEHYRGIDLLSSKEDTANHGTPSFGIVGGQFFGRKFMGMAPGVEFISIHRHEIEDIFEALIWARNIGAHAIMYEFGSWVGEFLDGSSNLEVFINDLYNDGIHQFTASGNLAGPARKKHASFVLESGDTETLQFTVPESYNITEVYFSLLWRNRVIYRPTAKLILSDTETATLYADGIPHSVGKYTVISGTDYATTELSPPTGTARFDVVISSDDVISGTMSFTFKNSRRVQLELDAYISDNKTMWMHGAQFQNHLTDDGTICSPGSAKKGITVGAYDPRGYRNISGGLSDFSSWGNTIDGRRAVDITAPGFTVFSPASHYYLNKQGGYVDFGGTSAALPHVVGCAALIMQASLGITPDELSRVLFEYALEDEFTGPVPNDKWGFGKLKTYESITKSHIATVAENIQQQEIFSVSQPYPNPFNTSTTFQIGLFSSEISPVDLDIYNVLGQKIRTMRTINEHTNSFRVLWDGLNNDGLPVASGIYFFHFYHKEISILRKALFMQ